jgi:hypothetical protein
MQAKVGAEKYAQFMRNSQWRPTGGPRGRANFRLRQPSGCSLVIFGPYVKRETQKSNQVLFKSNTRLGTTVCFKLGDKRENVKMF